MTRERTREDAFDTFYQASRGDLLHQTFALTGDLSATRSAVRDAYVAAWHHWRKVSACDQPLDWVRSRAWRLAQRRHTARRRQQQGDGVSVDTSAVLGALAKLSTGEREALLLTQLAGLSLAGTARGLGVPRPVAEQRLQAATAHLALTLDVESTSVRRHLDSLSVATAGVRLPRASAVRRSGRTRRRTHTAVAAVAATVTAVGAGAFVYQPTQAAVTGPTPTAHRSTSPAASPAASPTPVVKPTTGSVTADEPAAPTGEQLLDGDQIRRLGSDQDWRVVDTHDNTDGDGINTVCQERRFADPEGLTALVREFEAQGTPERSAVQTLEVSASTREAERAFDTTVEWYAGCRVARLQVLEAYRVDNIGDEANVLILRVWERPVTTYSVAVSRTGRVVTSTAGSTVGAQPPPAWQITQSLADATAMLCASSGADECATTPTFERVPPPPSGEERGVLAVADLPPVGRIDQPWVGTKAERTRENPAATTCDRADFAAAGVGRVRTRTFLIPQARVPSRFGISETYGVFDSARAAGRFLDTVRRRMARCEGGNLAAQVRAGPTNRGQRMEASTWQLSTKVSKSASVKFWIGLVRIGDTVAQVTFSPTARHDVSAEQFGSLVERAGDRLRELDGTG